MSKNFLHTQSRNSQSDIEIEFKFPTKHDGVVPFSIFVPKASTRASERQELVKQLGNVTSCGICCGQKAGTALCLARCVYGDGMCCDSGKDNCDPVGD